VSRFIHGSESNTSWREQAHNATDLAAAQRRRLDGRVRRQSVAW
jgi:hypothetical protein